jgi:hypothetical protein
VKISSEVPGNYLPVVRAGGQKRDLLVKINPDLYLKFKQNNCRFIRFKRIVSS